ncbi:MAG: hypothetical protein AAF721_32335, partial [Myxococcota bacterium]
EAMEPGPKGHVRPAEDDAFARIETTQSRAWVASLGAVRAIAGAEPLAVGTGAIEGFEAVALAETDEGARVVYRRGKLEVLLWVDAEDLQPMVRDAVTLSTAAGEARASAGVELGPGERVTVLATRDGWHHVRTAVDGFEGWLPVDALAKTAAHRRYPPAAAGDVGFVAAATPVQRAAGGRVFWKLPAADTPRRVVIEHEDGDWVRVSYLPPCPQTVRVVGFVRATSVERPTKPIGFGVSCGYPTLRGRTPPAARLRRVPGDPKVALSEGARLVDAHGHVVARTRAALSLSAGADGAVLVPTPWGALALRKHGAPARTDEERSAR